MITTDIGAYQEMCARIRTCMASADAIALNIGHTDAVIVRYANVDYSNTDKKALDGKVWVRFTTISAGEKRRTLGRPSRITYHGQAVAQLFTPRSVADAAVRSFKLAQVLKSAYSSSTSSVEFYRSMIRDMPDEEQWFAKQVTCTYEYQTLE